MKSSPLSEDRSPTRIRSVRRAMQALSCVVQQSDGATATEISRALELPTPTVFHLVNTLVDEGLLLKYDRRYQLGPQIGVIADAFLRQMTPPPHLLAPLRRRSEE